MNHIVCYVPRRQHGPEHPRRLLHLHELLDAVGAKSPCSTASSTLPGERLPAMTRWSPLSTSLRTMLKPIRPIPQIPMSMSSLPSVAQHACCAGLSACYALRARLSARLLPTVGGLSASRLGASPYA